MFLRSLCMHPKEVSASKNEVWRLENYWAYIKKIIHLQFVFKRWGLKTSLPLTFLIKFNCSLIRVFKWCSHHKLEVKMTNIKNVKSFNGSNFSWKFFWFKLNLKVEGFYGCFLQRYIITCCSKIILSIVL